MSTPARNPRFDGTKPLPDADTEAEQSAPARMRAQIAVEGST